MRREDVLHVCRAVTSQLGVVRLLALGSQAIHVLLEPGEVPEQLVASVELDVVVLDTVPGQGEPAQLISGAIGEGSDFHVTHGYYPDGMTLDEAVLPSGWEGRLRSLDVHRSDHPETPATLYAPELADLCASKLAANRNKDRAFTKTIVAAGLVGATDVLGRCQLLPAGPAREAAVAVAERIADGTSAALTEDEQQFAPSVERPRSLPSRVALQARRGNDSPR
jgi:hypothetical protein